MFMTMLSWAMPRKTEASPVSFHQRYASRALVPEPSECVTTHFDASPVRLSATILQKACGYRPGSRRSTAACTSLLEAETPRAA